MKEQLYKRLRTELIKHKARQAYLAVKTVQIANLTQKLITLDADLTSEINMLKIELCDNEDHLKTKVS